MSKKRIVSLALVCCMIISLFSVTAYAKEAPTIPSKGAVVYGDDVRVESGGTATVKYTVAVDPSAERISAFTPTYTYVANMTLDSVSASPASVSSQFPDAAGRKMQFACTGFVGSTIKTENVTAVFSNVTATGKPNLSFEQSSSLRAVFAGSSEKVDNKSITYDQPTIIVQQPLTVTIDGTTPTGGTVSATATAYDEGKETYDTNGTAYDLSEGGTLYVDTGSGQQNTPKLTVTAPDGYKAQYKIGSGVYRDVVGTEINDLGIMTAEKEVTIKFVSTATVVSVSVTPAEGGDIAIGTESVAGTDVTFTSSILSKRFKITPNTGYAIADVTYDGETVMDQVSGAGYYTLTMSANDIINGAGVEHNLVVTFTKQTFDVLAQAEGEGTVQYNGSAVENGAFNVEYTTSPVEVTFAPTDSSYKVDKVQYTTNTGRTWIDVDISASSEMYDVDTNTFTFTNGITSATQGVKVTFGTSINTIDPDTNPDPSNPDITIDPDPYDPNAAGMLILRGAWHNESTYQLKATVNGEAAEAGAVTWGVDEGYYNMAASQGGYGFINSEFNDNDILSVSANGLITVKNSGIVRVKCTSTVNPQKSFYIVVVVPGDYDRDGEITGEDADNAVSVYFNPDSLSTQSYAKEMLNINPDDDNEITGEDADTIIGLYFGLMSISED